jgi:hypothetical protein
MVVLAQCQYRQFRIQDGGRLRDKLLPQAPIPAIQRKFKGVESMHRTMVVGVLGIMDMPDQSQLPRQGRGCGKVHVVVVLVILRVMVVLVMHSLVRMLLLLCRVCVCIMRMGLLRARSVRHSRPRMNKMVRMFTHMPRLMMMVRHKPMPEEREPPQTKQEIC